MAQSAAAPQPIPSEGRQCRHTEGRMRQALLAWLVVLIAACGCASDTRSRVSESPSPPPSGHPSDGLAGPQECLLHPEEVRQRAVQSSGLARALEAASSTGPDGGCCLLCGGGSDQLMR